MNEGDLLVDSELVLPARPDLGVGERTRENHHGPHRIARDDDGNRRVGRLPSSSSTSVAARIENATTSRGTTRCEVVKDSAHDRARRYRVSGGCSDRLVARRLPGARAHSQGRRPPDRFFLIDLSSLGTTLNGRHVPKGYDEVDGTKRENGVETALPDTARIGLADTVFLEFRKGR